jgi:hypothetical protein
VSFPVTADGPLQGFVGVTDDNNVALCHFLAPGFGPQIEDVMQIENGQVGEVTECRDDERKQ